MFTGFKLLFSKITHIVDRLSTKSQISQKTGLFFGFHLPGTRKMNSCAFRGFSRNFALSEQGQLGFYQKCKSDFQRFTRKIIKTDPF